MNSGPQEAESTDAEILARVACGETAAFEVFYDRFATVLYGLAMQIVRDSHEADEVLQEAMTLIWDRAALYNPSAGKPLSWAITITRNKAIDRLRSSQRKARLLTEAATEWESSLSSTQVASESLAIGGETAGLVRPALVALPHDQRQAIELAFFAGLTQSEIAAQLKQPLGTIKARIRRGMMTLRDSLEGKL